MTIFDSRPTRTVVPAQITWAAPDTNLWVATLDGNYAGMIEFDNGHFVVRNLVNTAVATTATIPSAQRAFSAYVDAQSKSPAVRFFRSLTTPTSHTPFLDRRPRPDYARGKSRPR